MTVSSFLHLCGLEVESLYNDSHKRVSSSSLRYMVFCTPIVLKPYLFAPICSRGLQAPSYGQQEIPLPTYHKQKQQRRHTEDENLAAARGTELQLSARYSPRG